MPVPCHYALRSLFRRRASTLLTLAGLALVVMVYTALSALNAGIASAYQASGEADNLLVLRQGASTEGYSGVSRQRATILRELDGVARDGAGAPLVAPESVTIFNLEKLGGGTTNVLVRGVSPASPALRRCFKITAGRMFTPGLNELIVGEAIGASIKGLTVGSTLRNFNREWTVVGTFSCGRTAFASEVWGDAEIILPASEQREFNSVLLRARDAGARKQLTQQIESDPRLKLSARPERKYYRDQTEGPGIPPIFRYSVILCYILAFGALFGAANLLYAAIAYRRREIATLRVLGFSRASVVLLFMLEGLLLCLASSGAGILLAIPLTRLSLATTNFETFTTLSFSLRLTPPVIAGALAMGVFIGVFGAFFPALNAARTPVLDGLRKA